MLRIRWAEPRQRPRPGAPLAAARVPGARAPLSFAAMSCLAVYAAPVEGRALAGAGGAWLEVGTGKAAAAAALARALALGPRPRAVLAFGLAGAYPGSRAGLRVGDLCLLGSDLLADDGAAEEHGFRSLQAMGIGTSGPFAMDGALTARAAELLGGVPVVAGATVSSCSARDDVAAAVQARTGADVETMEGAALAVAAHGAGVALVQLRCVSNRCGARARAGWDVPGAAATVQAAVRRLLERGFP
jgi:futalosine hydrolase